MLGRGVPTALVEIADVGAGAVGVDLVDGDGQSAARGDFGDAVLGQLILGLLANIDVAGKLCPTAAVDDVEADLRITNDRRVLLTRTDCGAVACKSTINWEHVSIDNMIMFRKENDLTQETLRKPTVADGLQDDTVRLNGGHKSREGEQGRELVHIVCYEGCGRRSEISE